MSGSCTLHRLEQGNWGVCREIFEILLGKVVSKCQHHLELGWNRAMEIVHLEQWVQFMDDSEVEMWYKEKLGVSNDSFRVSQMSTYEKNFLDKDIETLAHEIHRRKFSNVLHKMQMNMKLLKIMDQMEVYYMYHLDEPCPDILKKNVRNRIKTFMEQHKMKKCDKISKVLLFGNEEHDKEVDTEMFRLPNSEIL